MECTTRQRIYGRRAALSISFIISVITLFIMLISFAFAKSKDLARGVSILDFITIRSWIWFLLNTILLYVLLNFQFWAVERLRHHSKGTLMVLLGSLGLVVVLSPCFARLHWELFEGQGPLNLYLTIFFVKDLILLIITLLFTALIYTWHKSRETILLNQQLKMESLENRYEALKNQVDPHFFFNSLNTLNGLIGYDDDKAHKYVEQLSSVFRYTIQSKHVITLENELDFVKSYIYLMKIRYHDALCVEFDLDEAYNKYCIIPFGLQLLVENAIKHNVVSGKYPLLIRIETTPDHSVKVINNIRPKVDHAGTGIGLSNLNERYRLLFDRSITIRRENACFEVELPLIGENEKCLSKFGEK